MKNLRHLLCTAITFMMCIHAYAQKTAVSGIITDSTGQPVAGASVIDMQDKANGTISDADGKWSLTCSPSTALEFSFLGFRTLVQKVEGHKEINVVLQDDAEFLDEVIVIGYGTMDKKELTSAISHVSEKDFLTPSSLDPTMMIQGKVPGVSITNTGAGDPNNQASIQIRGVSSRSAGLGPLIVIDGVPGGNLTEHQS